MAVSTKIKGQVITSRGEKFLIKDANEIARGGEGKVVAIDNRSDIVAKIYHQGIKPFDKGKFTFLERLDDNYFVRPKDLLFDSSSKVVGFTMQYLDQGFFPMSTIYGKAFCKRENIDKKLKLKMAEKLISAVKYAHSKNVIIGDLNPYNVMVNNSGVVKFIDTDSYEVPGFPHSGILLDDIRDYYYQGRVGQDSDYFALSLMVFNMFSFTHPFKGIHKKWMKTADRMIHKAPIFVPHPDLKVPKSFEPIQDQNLMAQFKRIFVDGERFLLSLGGVDGVMIAVSPLAKPSLVKKYEQDELMITILMSDSVQDIFFLDSQGIIETDTEFVVYDSANKGYLTLRSRFNKTEYNKVYVGEKNIITQKREKLFLYDKGVEKEIKSFRIPEKGIIHQMGNILLVIDHDSMTKVYLDEVLGATIKTHKTPVFGKGFTIHNGLINNSGGKQNIFFSSSKGVSAIQSPLYIQGIYQQGSVGAVEYLEKKNVKRKFFKIRNMKMEVSSKEISGIPNFAYKPGGDEGFIFEPQDDKISVIRSNDFEEISEMKCNLSSADSVIRSTNAGLILLEGDAVYLLNKK